MSIYELIIRFNYSNRCRKGYIWCIGGNFIHLSKFKESGEIPYGYVLTDNKVASLRKSISIYTWSRAELYCTECINADKSGYFPSSGELALLYQSIMLGKMKEDLITAGIYGECNYKEPSCSSNGFEWWYVWSSSEYDSSIGAYNVSYYGSIHSNPSSFKFYAIPFFKF